ncbi:MAG: hypothetical protein BM564_09410 [Bacteroidetes bacterium MedPE-SWsnd-G2]|nr:MAG: hypothetical protein BM564_09410 [Bacteroidetes bacterium MedPE-SWsnd-G2]
MTLALLFCFSFLSANAQYCNSDGNDEFTTGIRRVIFNTIDNSTPIETNAYSDFTTISTSVTIGNNYNLSSYINTAGDWNIYVYAFIDWNQDGDFLDSNESYNLGFAKNVTNGISSISPSITIPNTAVIGSTRMRVSARYNIVPGPCDENFDGEVEDYTIVVQSAVPAPEISITGNGNTIINNDLEASITDGTDFGNLAMGITNTNTFTIENQGNLDLIVSDITLSNSANFSIDNSPGFPTTISDGNSLDLDITYLSNGEGTNTSILTISSNDIDESNYQFRLSGASECSPIQITGSFSTPASCEGCSDMSVTVGSPIGGVGNYNYSLDGIKWVKSNTFTGLSEPVFTVYARDSNGCIGSERITSYINFSAGACVIDMGIVPQTENNALVPYGLIYDLVQNYDIPIYWVINPTKTFVNASNITNQTDISVSGTTTRLGSTPISADLKAGPFLIPSEYIDDAYTVIEQWISDYSGLTIYWNLDAISNAPINGIITTLANVVIYPKDGDVNDTTDIEQAFFIPAGIPNSVYRRASITDIDFCDEIYVLSHHTDPDLNWDQDDIDAIYDYVINGGNVWMGCHDVSITESLLETSEGKQLNFLSNSGLIPYQSTSNISTNYPYLSSFINSGNSITDHDNTIDENAILYNLNSASHPLMQFMEEFHAASNGNSERVFLPFIDGWRSTTVAAVYDPTHSDLPSGTNRSSGEAAVVAYGPAYGNSLNGTILYQGSHINKANNGTMAEYVGERRIFGNYLLESAIKYRKDAGSDQSFNLESCGTVSTTLNASQPIKGDFGTWSIVSGTGGSFESVNNPKSEFYGQENESYVLKWTVSCEEDLVEISFTTACSTLDFDGIDDYVTFGNNYEVSNAFSVETWIKSEENNLNSQTILSKRNSKDLTTGFDLSLVDNIISFNWDEFNSLSSPYPISTERWYHLAVTFNGSEYNLFIDGVLVNSTTGSAPTPNSSITEFILGAMDQTSTEPFRPTNYYKGWIDEVRIWDVGLTANQIRIMMNQEITEVDNKVTGSIIPIEVEGINWDNLTGYYQLNQSTDISNGNINPIKGIPKGRLRNSSTWQNETAPLPYTTKADGYWNDVSSSTPWTYGDSVWDAPNSIGVDGTTNIDWNIVETNNNILINTYSNLGRARSVLGLKVNNSEIELTGDNALNTGNGLTITHYLKLDGTIDLNGESQLIQSENSVLDPTSSGKLEKDQQGTSDTYTYNYWSSPVGTINTTSNNNAYTLPTIFKDGTNSNDLEAINFISSGYNGTNSSPIGLADYWIWKFANQLDDDYSAWQHVRSTGTLLAGEGFTMKGPGTGSILDPQNYAFVGKPNNGDINLTLNAGNDYLVGNPYPSAIDANQFILDNGPVLDYDNPTDNTPLISGTLYFWEHWGGGSHYLAEYQGGYATYNFSGSVPAASLGTNDPDVATGGAPTKLPGRYIPVGQGFFVVGESNGTINFNNGQRVFQKEGNGNSVFVRTSQTASNSEEESLDHRMKIRLGFNSISTLHRQILLTIDPAATLGIDWAFDAKLYEQQADDLFWMLNDEKFVIQGSNELNSTSVYPIGIKVGEDGTNTITIDALENIPEELNIYIHDSELNSYHDLRQSDFEIYLAEGNYLNRFNLVFESQSSTLSLEDEQLNELNIYYSNYRQRIVILNPNNLDLKQLEVYSILGQPVFNLDNLNQSNYHEYTLPDFSTGTYIIKLRTETSAVSKKIILK